jgi:hypothetical protein
VETAGCLLWQEKKKRNGRKSKTAGARVFIAIKFDAKMRIGTAPSCSFGQIYQFLNVGKFEEKDGQTLDFDRNNLQIIK